MADPFTSEASMKAILPTLSKLLLQWYKAHARELPWRQNRDPYRIWISEVMLQQTTVAAVVPFYEKFMNRFPHLKSLAQAPVEDVLQYWAGLGYYSRARNLHKSAIHLQKRGGFPKTAAELLELPGFGPYTSRAVSSLAFGEAVGVLDGNVIRILSRVFNAPIEHWKTPGKLHLQNLADQFAQSGPSAELNQAMMELGATVCTPKNPACLICPWMQKCEARKANAVSKLPLAKPRREQETWIWSVELFEKQDQFLLVKPETTPVLKKQWIFPGEFTQTRQKPKDFAFKHSITHHNIYIRIQKILKWRALKAKDQKWVPASELSSVNPSSMLQKVLQHARSPLSSPDALKKPTRLKSRKANHSSVPPLKSARN
jgi:A/G-specific adenine glycosylase